MRLDLIVITVMHLCRQCDILSSQTYQIDSAEEDWENVCLNDKLQRDLARLNIIEDSALLFFDTKKKTLLVSLNDQELTKKEQPKTQPGRQQLSLSEIRVFGNKWEDNR